MKIHIHVFGLKLLQMTIQGVLRVMHLLLSNGADRPIKLIVIIPYCST